MRRLMIAAIVLLILLAACDGATGGGTTDQLTVNKATANLALPTDTGAIYAHIHNGTGSDDALIGAAVSGCEAVELHEMTMQDDVMIMHQVEGNRIAIPAGETVTLRRGGLHVMCIGKTTGFVVGESVSVTFEFEHAGLVQVTAEIIDPAGMHMDGEH